MMDFNRSSVDQLFSMKHSVVDQMVSQLEQDMEEQKKLYN